MGAAFRRFRAESRVAVAVEAPARARRGWADRRGAFPRAAVAFVAAQARVRQGWADRRGAASRAAVAIIAAGLTLGAAPGGEPACCTEAGEPAARQGATSAAAGARTGELRAALDTLAALPGEPRIVSAAGVSRDETPLLTLENPSPFDPSRAERRMVLVGGLEGDADAAARIVLDAVRWFKSGAPEEERTRWAVSALPMAHPSPDGATRPGGFPPAGGFFDDPDRPESRYVWRWVAYQAPDLVVEVRAGDGLIIHSRSAGESGGTAGGAELPTGSLAAAVADPANQPGLGPVDALHVTAGASDGAAVMREALARVPGGPSPLRDVLADRIARDPLELARVLARRYPGTPSISYIPALAWVHSLRLAALDGDPSLRDKVMAEVRPWLSGERPLFGDRISFAVVAGTMIFSELAQSPGGDRDAAARLAAEGVALARAETAPGVPRHGSGWSDDFFLGTIAAVRAGDPEGLAAAVRLVITYAARLQQPDGLFHHDAGAPTAWGRGNGFAALGLSELLTVLSADHPEREKVLDIHRRHLAAMRAHQAPDGMWRQVVDEPGSYRETSVTAMTLTATARGIRLGWLDASYRPVVDRAWRALLAHVLEDGTLVDVCIGTGAGPTRRHYLDRSAVNGADDRGGAMALGAALEYHRLLRSD